MPKYPANLRVGSPKGADFKHRPGFFAVRQSSKASRVGALVVMADDASHAFAVFKGKPEGRDADQVGPVYSAGPEGPLAVPTGRLLVRFEQGVQVEDHMQDLEGAGFIVEKTLSYAPNAAWVRHKNGGVEQALNALSDLEGLPEVVHVEPQVLVERSKKG